MQGDGVAVGLGAGGLDGLGEAIFVVADESARSVDDGWRAAVVDTEGDALQAGVDPVEADDALDAGAAEGVERLVLVADAEALAERTGEGRFYVACVGQFKRGKSTLIGVSRPEAVKFTLNCG